MVDVPYHTSVQHQERLWLRREDEALLASVTPGVEGVEKALATLLEACGGDRKVID